MMSGRQDEAKETKKADRRKQTGKIRMSGRQDETQKYVCQIMKNKKETSETPLFQGCLRSFPFICFTVFGSFRFFHGINDFFNQKFFRVDIKVQQTDKGKLLQKISIFFV